VRQRRTVWVVTTALASRPVGPLLKDWRVRRRRSQMDLALDVGVSPRHLSFVETGRSKPSPELLVALADHLEVPLRDRNTLLLAAGYAPRYLQTSLDDPEMAAVRRALQRMLDGHDPYPGIVIDRSWNVVLANEAALRLVASLPPELAGPPLNVFRACLHPNGLARATLNFPDWAAYLLGQLDRLRVITADPEVSALAEEVAQYPNVAGLGSWRPGELSHEPVLLVPWWLKIGGKELSLFTMVTTFGTPQDITLAELAVELFYPADDTTDAFLGGR
jgi:transcriptional regulator with XRE-family HTH domain